MRLISQDGMMDCAYENITLCIRVYKYDDYFRADIFAFTLTEHYCMGSYSTKEKALKVMKDLREDWKDDLAFFYFPADEDVKESDNQ